MLCLVNVPQVDPQKMPRIRFIIGCGKKHALQSNV